MKPILLALLLLLPISCFAASEPVDLKVERRTLDREERIRGKGNNREELIRGLHITVKNNGAKPAAEGVVEWEIIVQRAGIKSAIISKGKEPLKALGAAQSAQFTVGAVPVMENRSKEQDMEFRVVVRQGALEAAKATSTPDFEALAKNAHSIDKPEPGEKPRKEKKK